jgi:2-dehydro-3-deoxyphosphooctonate aldolase (KDO 8-P synthase)
MKIINVNDILLGGNNPIALIGGPCVIESESLCIEVCKHLYELCKKMKIGYIFKSSYDKANRTSIKSFRGPGIKKGLKILSKIKEKFNVPILTDIHSVEEAKEAAKVCDIIQIPAFLSRQTDIVLAAAKTNKVVNVKKSQLMSPHDIKYVIEKIESVGNKKILITERGSMFGYNNLVSDLRSIDIMKKFGYPIVYDASHSAQEPSRRNGKSTGKKEYVILLAKAAVAVGVSAIFIEVHPDPKNALSDAYTSLDFESIDKLFPTLVEIDKIIKRDLKL